MVDRELPIGPFYHIPVHATIVSRVEPTAQIYSEVANMPPLTVAQQDHAASILVKQPDIAVNRLKSIIGATNWIAVNAFKNLFTAESDTPTVVVAEPQHLPIGQMAPIPSDLEVAIHYLEVLLASRIDEKADLLAKASHVDGTILLVQETLEVLRDSQ